MRKKLIYLISFVVALSLASTSYGIVIGDFEGQMDGWGKDDPCDPNITLTYSATGATLDACSLKIADATGNSFERAINYSLVANNDVNEFRKNLKVSLDVTRLSDDWDGPHGGWLGTTFLGWSEFHLIVEAGSTDANVGKGIWSKGWNLKQIANWGSWDGNSPMSVTYDYSTLLNQIDFNNLTYLGLVLVTNWGNYPPNQTTPPFKGGVYYLDNVKLVGEGMAYDPNPANGARSLEPDITLSWTQGAYAAKHDVYFGTSFNDVNNANRTNPLGVLKNKDQDANSYDPTLAGGTTYYWRIDEVNDACSPGLWKGAVWDFTTAYPGVRGVVIGDWEKGMNGWEATWQGKTTFHYSTKGATLGNYSLGVQTVKNTPDDPGYWIIQRSGLLNPTNMVLRLDVTLIASEWAGQTVEVGPLCVQTDLPHTWSSYTAYYAPGISGSINRNTGGLTGATWSGTSNAYRTYTFDLTGPDITGYTHTDWADANKMTILLALQNGAQGPGNFYIDNARLTDPRLAFIPRPANGATDVRRDPTLAWNAGKTAAKHDVYFGTDFNKVNDASRTSHPGLLHYSENQTAKTYVVPGILALGTTYYWRIDEIVTGPPLVAYKGDVWSFTTSNYLVVEDFKSYADDDALWVVWKTGSTRATVYLNTESNYVCDGNSMQYHYDNYYDPFYAEAYADIATLPSNIGSDWTANGVKALTLYFYGQAGNDANEQMYVKLTDGDLPAKTAKVPYPIGDMNDIRDANWHEWNIALQDFVDDNDVNLANVSRITIGFGDGVETPGTVTATVYFDDIRLYPPRCIPGVAPDLTGDCFVDYADLKLITDNWLISDYNVIPVAPPVGPVSWYKLEQDANDAIGGRNGTAVGSPTYTTDRKEGSYAIDLNRDGNDHVETAYNAAAYGIDGNKPRTITAWVYTRDFNDNIAGVYEIGEQVDGQEFALRVTPQTNVWRAQHWGSNWDIDFTYPSLNTWVHFAHVYDGTTVRVYADGYLVAKRAIALDTGIANNFSIGWFGDPAGNYYFNGIIDDVRIYNYALSQAQAASLAGKTSVFTQPMTPTNPDIDVYEDGTINLRDYAVLASKWLEEVLWP